MGDLTIGQRQCTSAGEIMIHRSCSRRVYEGVPQGCSMVSTIFSKHIRLLDTWDLLQISISSLSENIIELPTQYQPHNMKVAALTTLLFATVALASPAPVAQPEAAVLAHPAEILTTRDPAPILDARAKKPKPNSGNSNNTNSTGAAIMITQNRVLQFGALGLGVMEVVRLW